MRDLQSQRSCDQQGIGPCRSSRVDDQRHVPAGGAGGRQPHRQGRQDPPSRAATRACRRRSTRSCASPSSRPLSRPSRKRWTRAPCSRRKPRHERRPGTPRRWSWRSSRCGSSSFGGTAEIRRWKRSKWTRSGAGGAGVAGPPGPRGPPGSTSSVPGERVRITGIRDVAEPRVKVGRRRAGCFPASPVPVVRRWDAGRTHRLSGMTLITTAAYEGTIRTGTTAQRSAILDMWGPGADLSGFSRVPRPGAEPARCRRT